jgi:hypothetical protein
MHVLYVLFRMCSALSCGRMLLSRADTMTDMQYASVITSYRRKIADVLFECVKVVIAPYIVVSFRALILKYILCVAAVNFTFSQNTVWSLFIYTYYFRGTGMV